MLLPYKNLCEEDSEIRGKMRQWTKCVTFSGLAIH